jgi:hypothetical protein
MIRRDFQSFHLRRSLMRLSNSNRGSLPALNAVRRRYAADPGASICQQGQPDPTKMLPNIHLNVWASVRTSLLRFNIIPSQRLEISPRDAWIRSCAMNLLDILGFRRMFGHTQNYVRVARNHVYQAVEHSRSRGIGILQDSRFPASR